MTTENEFEHECNFICTACVEWVVVPFMPDINKFTECGAKHRVLRNSLEIKLTCDSESSKIRQGFWDLSLAWASAMAVDKSMHLPFAIFEMWATTASEEADFDEPASSFTPLFGLSWSGDICCKCSNVLCFREQVCNPQMCTCSKHEPLTADNLDKSFEHGSQLSAGKSAKLKIACID